MSGSGARPNAACSGALTVFSSQRLEACRSASLGQAPSTPARTGWTSKSCDVTRPGAVVVVTLCIRRPSPAACRARRRVIPRNRPSHAATASHRRAQAAGGPGAPADPRSEGRCHPPLERWVSLFRVSCILTVFQVEGRGSISSMAPHGAPQPIWRPAAPGTLGFRVVCASVQFPRAPRRAKPAPRPTQQML